MMHSGFECDPVYAIVQMLREPGAMASHLLEAWRQHGHTPPRALDVRIIQLHYKPFARARLLLKAEFDHPHTPDRRVGQFIFVQVYPTASALHCRMQSTGRKPGLECFGPPVMALAPVQAIAWLLPNSPRLRPLQFLLNRQQFQRFLRPAGLLPAGGTATESHPELKRLVPRRRALVRYADPHLTPGPVYCKLYEPKADISAARNLALLQQCAAQLEFAIPRMIHHDPKSRVVVMTEIPGVALSTLSDKEMRRGLCAVGPALASLHSSSLVPDTIWTAEAEVRALRRAMTDISAALPRCNAGIDATVAALAGQIELFDAVPSAPIHGNLFGDQILIDGTRVGIVDWDDLALGDPLYDIGRLMAHIVFLVGIREDTWSDIRGLLDELLKRYPIDHTDSRWSGRLRWQIAVALMMRAKIGSLRPLAPHWDREIERALGETQAVIEHRADWLPDALLQAPTRRSSAASTV